MGAPSIMEGRLLIDLSEPAADVCALEYCNAPWSCQFGHCILWIINLLLLRMARFGFRHGGDDRLQGRKVLPHKASNSSWSTKQPSRRATCAFNASQNRGQMFWGFFAEGGT